MMRAALAAAIIAIAAWAFLPGVPASPCQGHDHATADVQHAGEPTATAHAPASGDTAPCQSHAGRAACCCPAVSVIAAVIPQAPTPRVFAPIYVLPAVAALSSLDIGPPEPPPRA